MALEDLFESKTTEQLVDESVTQLRADGFRIRNFRSGRVFYTLIELFMSALAGLYKLLLTVLKQIYTHSASGGWLDLKVADNGVYRKQAVRTQGMATFGRNVIGGQVLIPAGTIAKTEVDTNGNELRYLTTQDTLLPSGQLEVLVPVEAEVAGADYNVGAGQIIKQTVFIPGIDYVTNSADWITREGSDIESDDSLRQRAELKWQQLSLGANADAYKSLAMEVAGVVTARPVDDHPRGEGTVDIIITSSQGVPTQQLVDETQAHVNAKKSLIADVLVYGPTPVPIDISATIYIDPTYGDAALTLQSANSITDEMFKYTTDQDTNSNVLHVHPDYGVDRSMIISNYRMMPYVVKVELAQPAADVTITRQQIAVKGVVNLTVTEAITG